MFLNFRNILLGFFSIADESLEVKGPEAALPTEKNEANRPTIGERQSPDGQEEPKGDKPAITLSTSGNIISYIALNCWLFLHKFS